MREPRFYLPTGEELPKSETSRHHIFTYEWDKGYHRRVRQMGSLSIRMHNPLHLPQYPTSLHANVDHPITPHMGVAKDIYEFMRSSREQDFDHLERLDHLVQHLGYLSFSSPRQRTQEEAGLLQENLKEQMVFIREGAVHHE